MKIRHRLSLQFSIIVASILFFFSLGIYYFSSTYREKEFLSRLEMRAISNARMLLDIKEIDRGILKIIDRNTLSSLFELQVVILDRHNHLFYLSKDADSLAIPDQYKHVLDTEDKVQFKIEKNEGVGILYNSKGITFKVFVWAYDKTGMEQLRHLRIILIVGFFVSIVGIWISGYFFAGRSMRPISKVVKQVEKITASNLNLRVDTGPNRDEIAHLAATFNQMLERLDAAFQMQRNFVSNASHELRTPLTAITGQIEVALLNERDVDEYKNIMKSLLDDIKDLNKLSNGLLELAQSSINFQSIKLTPLRVDDLLFEAMDDIKRRHPEYIINIDYFEIYEDDSTITIFGNENLLKAAFGNIMDNGCKFSDDKRIDVKISATIKEVKLSFIDRGIGIPKSETDKVFEPFYRAKNSKNIVGHGIGLSLTYKIVEMHKGRLSLISQENVGTEIIVTLPLNLT